MFLQGRGSLSTPSHLSSMECPRKGGQPRPQKDNSWTREGRHCSNPLSEVRHQYQKKADLLPSSLCKRRAMGLALPFLALVSFLIYKHVHAKSHWGVVSACFEIF